MPSACTSDGAGPRRLRGIYDEQESMPFGKGRYPRQIGSISGHIGSMSDYDCLGIGAQQRFQLVVLQHTAGIDSQKSLILPPAAANGTAGGGLNCAHTPL